VQRKLVKEIFILLIILSIAACRSIGSTEQGVIVESTAIVTKKYINNNGQYFVETHNSVSNKRKEKVEVMNYELWEDIKLDDQITLRYGKGNQTYIKAVNNKVIYDQLTGYVKEKIEEDGRYFVLFDFDQIGEELKQFHEEEWNSLKIEQQVTYSVDLSGGPNTIIDSK